MIDPGLEAAYRQTDYVAGPYVIRVGETCALAADWAFITACNPQSRPLPEAENAERMRQFEADVIAGGWRFVRGVGVGRDGAWPPEPSLLVLEIAEVEAVALARRYDQTALVVGRTGEPARLVWING